MANDAQGRENGSEFPSTDVRRPQAGDRAVTPQAQRALDEAAQRRREARAPAAAREINGRDGPEPVRYGDWENKGIASDF